MWSAHGKMSRGFAFAKSERVDRSEASAFGIDHVCHQRGAVLFSADAGRCRHQWWNGAGQLSGLPLSRSESFVVAGEFRAFGVGSVWVQVHDGSGGGGGDAG